ncbi:phosphoethanolamine transferase [Enterobacter asburiae]|uniref:Phosphoethanolamine transferase n=1 Tax=Enterobacter asburiae TaxID=61645 RepID=A0A376FIG8_ENTAS|nr:phosphoethanolamine transferase [Enterobacter asburiae]
MQSEMWFYTNTLADNIAYREQIGAEPRNRGKNVDDMLLLEEMSQSPQEPSAGQASGYSAYQKGRITVITSATRVISRSGSLSAWALIKTAASRS